MRFCTTFLISSVFSFIILVFLLIFISQTNPQSRMFLPVPLFRPIPIAIASNVCTSTTPFLGLVLVLSHPANVDKRNMVRETYPEEEIAPLGYRRVFVLGTTDGKQYRNLTVTDADVQAESDKHGDIIQLRHTEVYEDIILKVYGIFKWVADNCMHARFVIKNDDDMFFDYYLMQRALKKIPDFEVDNNIFGHLIVDEWNLTPYTAGGTYLMAPQTMEMLIDAVTTIDPPIQPFIHFAEDVYFTGLVADRMGIIRTDLDLIRVWSGPPFCCSTENGDNFQCKFSVFLQAPKQLPLEMLFRFKEHGKMCYFFHCERFSTALLSRSDVKCFRW